MPKLYFRLIAGAVFVLLVVVALTLGPAACTSLLSAKKEARVAKGQAGAAMDSSAEAMNTVSNVMAADAEADQIREDGLDAIRNAPEGERGTATIDAVCRLRQYRNHQRCAGVRQADPGQPAGAGAGR